VGEGFAKLVAMLDIDHPDIDNVLAGLHVSRLIDDLDDPRERIIGHCSAMERSQLGNLIAAAVTQSADMNRRQRRDDIAAARQEGFDILYITKATAEQALRKYATSGEQEAVLIESLQRFIDPRLDTDPIDPRHRWFEFESEIAGRCRVDFRTEREEVVEWKVADSLGAIRAAMRPWKAPTTAAIARAEARRQETL
jgi:hypothetical protein